MGAWGKNPTHLLSPLEQGTKKVRTWKTIHSFQNLSFKINLNCKLPCKYGNYGKYHSFYTFDLLVVDGCFVSLLEPFDGADVLLLDFLL